MSEYTIFNERTEVVQTVISNQIRYDGNLILFCKDEYNAELIFNLPPGWSVLIPDAEESDA